MRETGHTWHIMIDSHVEFARFNQVLKFVRRSWYISLSNLSVSYFMVYWLPQSYEIFFGNRKKICRYIHGLLKNRYKVLLMVRQISQMRCRCGSQPMLTKKYFAYFFHIIFDLYPYPPFFRHSSTKRDKQEKHYGRNNTCPNEHDNILSFHFVPPWNVLSIFFRAISSVPPK